MRESPTAICLASKKLKHIAPPIRGSSAPPSAKRRRTASLSTTLAPAQHDDQRGLRMVAHRRELEHLALEQESGVGGERVRDAGGGRVRAVRRAERMVERERRRGE